MILHKTLAQEAADYLAKHDPVLAEIIVTQPPCTIRPHKNYYQELASSIISQQLSVKAAASIEKRFRALFGSEAFPPPQQILEKDIDTLRSAGLSRAKAVYIQDLATHVLADKIRFDRFEEMTNEEIINELTAVKGIGEWTAHMFLMFSLARSDILAHGDLGIRNGIQKLYRLKTLPDKDVVEKLAKKHKWHPFETVACWYIWQALDNAP